LRPSTPSAPPPWRPLCAPVEWRPLSSLASLYPSKPVCWHVCLVLVDGEGAVILCPSLRLEHWGVVCRGVCLSLLRGPFVHQWSKSRWTQNTTSRRKSQWPLYRLDFGFRYPNLLRECSREGAASVSRRCDCGEQRNPAHVRSPFAWSSVGVVLRQAQGLWPVAAALCFWRSASSRCGSGQEAPSSQGQATEDREACAG